MLERQQAEALFLENLARIERIAASLCRRNGLSGDEADDFGSWARMKLVEDDYAVLRKFRGESALPTYLTVVLTMLFRDYRVREWGRWRASAAAQRLGEVAVRLETLVHRDGCSLEEAARRMRAAGATELSDRALAELLGRLPDRSPLRPPTAGLEALEALPAPEGADALVLAGEAERRRRETEEALRRALQRLPVEDRVIVRMRVWEDMSLADVARSLGLPQKPLYRRLERVFTELRRHLEADGVSRERVRDLFRDTAA
ncbi:MAG TPA: sigma-70 family RNA polymerase sigma factor [Longimicrobiaceae bacterium]